MGAPAVQSKLQLGGEYQAEEAGGFEEREPDLESSWRSAQSRMAVSPDTSSVVSVDDPTIQAATSKTKNPAPATGPSRAAQVDVRMVTSVVSVFMVGKSAGVAVASDTDREPDSGKGDHRLWLLGDRRVMLTQ